MNIEKMLLEIDKMRQERNTPENYLLHRIDTAQLVMFIENKYCTTIVQNIDSGYYYTQYIYGLTTAGQARRFLEKMENFHRWISAHKFV